MLLKGEKMVNCSRVWQDFTKVVQLLRMGISWQVESGSSTSFWNDSWLMKEPLATYVLGPILSSLIHVPVRYFWNGLDN